MRKLKNMQKLTKSKERVKKYGEVFTPEWVVKEMCDNLVEHGDKDVFMPEKTFLEPTCGEGVFLIEILKRKLKNGADEKEALKSIYGVDILEDNVLKTRENLKRIVLEHFEKQVDEILKTNIMQGDFLKGQDKIIFKDWNTGETTSLKEMTNDTLL